MFAFFWDAQRLGLQAVSASQYPVMYLVNLATALDKIDEIIYDMSRNLSGR